MGLRWIAGIAGLATMVAATLFWTYVAAMACAFGSPSGTCPPLYTAFLTAEGAVWFGLPFSLGLWLVVMALWGGRLRGVLRAVIWAVPVVLVLSAWGISRPSGFFHGQPSQLDLGIESYHDHPVVVTGIVLNGAEVFLPRPEVVSSDGDLRGPRWGAGQALRRPWPIAPGGRVTLQVDWLDLRSGDAWEASAQGVFDDIVVEPGYGAGAIARLAVVIGPEGAMVMASDRLTATGEWILTPVDVAKTCGTRVPARDRGDLDAEGLFLAPAQLDRLRAPRLPPLVQAPARLPQPAHHCASEG